MIVLFVFLTLISLSLLLWQISNLISVFYGSPYVSVKRDIVRKALKLVHLKKGEIFYDLGSGNGDVLIEAAKLKAKVFGFEISPFYFLISKIRTFKYPNVQIKYQNIKNIDLKKADVVYCYLLPELLEKLSVKFIRELKIGSQIISISFPIKNLSLMAKHKFKNSTLYIYKI